MSDIPARGLSHISDDGAARMVDVSAKPDTARTATATGVIRMQAETLAAIVGAQVKKGDVLGTARIAGIVAAKRTAELIPLCHPLSITDARVELAPDASIPGVRVTATVRTVGPTGVEMEALTAASIALLTVYDMAKALDRGMEIGHVSLAEKTGGASGNFTRAGTGSAP
ncbi:MAG TPA: cyclic pyranopterin monophosphate synthase MoaC [Gemmatimonadaceae bacterium]|jgi:cyclic pyranopterin phosphate synthase|nr:cyclic pyranopterin monophosphate synthase MoaC [Gemmatimonadaceae bacterium]